MKKNPLLNYSKMLSIKQLFNINSLYLTFKIKQWVQADVRGLWH